ncbi:MULTISPECIES: hypothetical protein [Enterobacteriaceae]|jgi:hypothetical protein|nr:MULTISPECIES: hypothetical protein [Enterobacteriaceae]EKV5657537.1 hypothetical protein [Citrobacter farmeri]EKW2929206.1 hypothetical protein [Citrobacter amalonaticus]MDQ2233055.1 hypothetical protein [Citrobacter portucalensis]HDZ9280035.1 hypothetical protein [Klebsiella pneumoniae]AYL59467.1 hypothetical protein CUC48_24400 [Citrobacter freundii]
MLFTYTPLSLEENWLNSTIINILNVSMRSILNGGDVSSWPDIIPPNRRLQLQTRSGIRDRILNFLREFIELERVNQEALLIAMEQQTSLPNVLYDDSVCTGIGEFPENMRKVADDLFRFLFEKQLTTINILGKCLRDIHYEAIYYHLPWRICPFCGLGYLRAPGAPRHALDHFMPISKYPFAGADFRNLPPMCSECNSDFKKNTDVLIDEDGHRRHCVDPYHGPFFKVSLSESIPFAGSIRGAIRLPKWDIKFIGEPQEQAENWDRIFKIRERYKRDVLDVDFRFWLEQFSIWYLSSNQGQLLGNEIAASIPGYIDSVLQVGLADRAFLKAQVFKLLHVECLDPDRGDDMKAFLEDLMLYT